ncbi:hypothetical protein BU15DRAFT_77272 [Melanogaster broomeanus]|nr:hypothetical protein BU15DRAFT_77272 [Melanogaster broomeanus]
MHLPPCCQRCLIPAPTSLLQLKTNSTPLSQPARSKPRNIVDKCTVIVIAIKTTYMTRSAAIRGPDAKWTEQQLEEDGILKIARRFRDIDIYRRSWSVLRQALAVLCIDRVQGACVSESSGGLGYIWISADIAQQTALSIVIQNFAPVPRDGPEPMVEMVRELFPRPAEHGTELLDPTGQGHPIRASPLDGNGDVEHN